MASISSLYGSGSTSSIYGNRNVISGLASGLDTETLIENSVMGYKTKIQQLVGKQTKLSWKQDAYRSITDKMIAMREKYTSYLSKTNLSSPSYFSNAVTTTTGGSNKDKVSATGRSNSDVKIDAVRQLASAAKYTVKAGDLYGSGGGLAVGGKFDPQEVKVSNITGGMTLNVGNSAISLSFGKTETFENAGELAEAINKKLAEQNVNSRREGTVTADKMVTAKAGDDGRITFELGSAAEKGDAIYIKSVSGKFGETLGITAGKLGEGDTEINVPAAVDGKNPLYETQDAATYLSDKTIKVTLDGTTKTISLGKLDKDGDIAAQIEKNLSDGLKDAFGSKVDVELKDGKLAFSTSSQNSTLRVTSEVGEAIGLGTNGVSNYMDTSKTIGELLGSKLNGMSPLGAVGEVKDKGDGTGTDEAGNSVVQSKDGWVRVDNEGKLLYGLEINGKQVGAFTRDTSLERVLSAINSSDAGVKVSYSKMTDKFTFTATETGSEGRIDFDNDLARSLFGGTSLNLSTPTGTGAAVLQGSDGKALAFQDERGQNFWIGYDKTDGKYYKTYENGDYMFERIAGKKVKIQIDPEGDSPASEALQSALKTAREGFTAGKDAILSATVNGETITMTRSSNVVDFDGMSVTLKGTFNEDSIDKSGGSYTIDKEKVEEGSEVTFTTKANADDLVETIKGYVEEYNAIMKEVRESYSTQPAKKYGSTSTAYYEPLTDEQKADMSESEIKAYEEKAKQGLLFGDTDLSRLYNSLRTAISPYGDDRKAMEAIGLTTSYSEGLTTLTLDENRLREALETNPDMVQKAFTQSKENGAASDGIIARMKKTMDTYASTSIGNYGVLVRKAGTKTKSLTLMDNTLQKQMNNIDDQIDRWQEKMSDKIDYYTRQFTQLEQLMAQMNSQSSALAGLMGGY